jgi:hypothetical protein
MRMRRIPIGVYMAAGSAARLRLREQAGGAGLADAARAALAVTRTTRTSAIVLTEMVAVKREPGDQAGSDPQEEEEEEQQPQRRRRRRGEHVDVKREGDEDDEAEGSSTTRAVKSEGAKPMPDRFMVTWGWLEGVAGTAAHRTGRGGDRHSWGMCVACAKRGMRRSTRWAASVLRIRRRRRVISASRCVMVCVCITVMKKKKQED